MRLLGVGVWFGAVVLAGCGGVVEAPLGDGGDWAAANDGGPGAITSDAAAANSCAPQSGRTAPATGCASPTPGLAPPLLDYAFDGDGQNGGTLGGKYDAALHGADFVAGRHGQAVRVGSAGWVSLPGTADLLRSQPALTIALWVKVNWGPLSTPIIDCRSFDEGFQTYHGVYHDTELTTCFGTGDGDAFGGCRSFSAAPCGWHQLIFRERSHSAPVELFYDGVPQAKLAADPGYVMFGPSLNDIWLGKAHEGTGWQGGGHRIDDLRVYGEAFSDQDQCTHVFGGRWCGGQCYPP